MTLYPTGEEVLLVGSIACGFQVEVGEPTQFEANIARPATSAFGQDAFRTPWDKAAALLHSFATTQTLIDGNKRTAWAACWLFLRLNRIVTKLQGQVDPDLSEKFVLDIAAGQKGIPEIADGLQRFVYPQLGKYGHLPDGFQITSILTYSDGILTGVGTLPDGTILVYQYLTLADDTPMEIVMTPDQARNVAEGLLEIADVHPEYHNKEFKRFPVEGIVSHHDIHHPPQLD